VLVATSQGFLLCYDLEGAAQWHLLFETSLQHLVARDEKVIAIDDKGILRVIDQSGQIEKQLALLGPCSLVSSTDDKIYLACGNSITCF
jgi:hypothetical protein